MFKGLTSEPLVDENGAPAQTVFSQQRLEAWRPLFTPTVVILLLMITGSICLALGIVFYLVLRDEIEIDVRYDDQCTEIGEQCNITVDVPTDIAGNVFLSYRLTNYPQNHNRYVSSRSNSQLRGEYVDYSGMSDCGDYRSINGSEEPEDWLLPCGAIALSFFNDTYQWEDEEGKQRFAENGISWRSDRQKLFKKLSDEYTTGIKWMETEEMNETFPNGQRNEHFIVWMRTATLPTFIKPYGRCVNCEIPQGQYNITIQNNYPASIFNGEKHLVISTVGPLGGRNILLGISYMTVGSVLMVCGLIVVISRIIYPRKLGDASNIVTRY